jgi:hypothetical protein
MISQGNGQSPSYSVSMSAHTRAIIKGLHRQAIQEGTGEAFLGAFRQIIARLKKEPMNVGEPNYRLASLQLQIRQVVLLPLVVDFAVHEQLPHVFIRGVKVLS